MAEISFPCDVRQGFNFEKDAQVTMGYIHSINIGESAELKPDTNVTDPISADFAGKFKVFGVISNIYWTGGYADPLMINAQVSQLNKPRISTMTHTKLKNTSVTINFTIYDYDPVVKEYYKCFHTADAEVKGLIMKSGGGLSLSIDNEQSMMVPSPKNYAFSIGIMPVEQLDQALQCATSKSGNFVKRWGVEVA